ncbi:fibronectin type-III domain-containing protein 3A isoform X2 [Nilaparvata lugens]|nr:fibronectin type-III domain-containing protein 3A isoform X2 [Nilaparvata lugens]
MVKVLDEDGSGRRVSGGGGSGGGGQSPGGGGCKGGTSNMATQHFHYHWSYPSAPPVPAPPPASPPSPATIHFGPGFEPQTSPQQHVVYFHVNPGVTVSFQTGDNVQNIKGPVTVPMVSTNSSPPIAMPVTVPHGHVVQQIVDENGTLRHVILSPQHPPIVPIPPHFGPGPASGSNQPHQPFFAPQGLPPGYPPFGHGAPLQPGLLSHVHPNQQGHSPPPAHNFHKDERTQRQYNKLRKKLEQKNVRGVTPPSPRKEFANGVRSRKSIGGGSVGTSEDGDGEESSSVQDEDDDTSLALLTEILNSIKPPEIVEVTSRSVLLQWWPPDCKSSPELDITESDLRYEVLLSDKGKEGKYKPIYGGAARSCRVQDLRPGTEYSVCVTAYLGVVSGKKSEATVLRTPTCAPDTPQAPKLLNRTRFVMQLKWTAAPDNGAPITRYVLECDEGKGVWKECYSGKGRQYTISKLQPATNYKFRLYAVNDAGQSAYSEVSSFWTAGSPPPQPSAPALIDAHVQSLVLGWERRPTDDEFTLQMEDRDSGHGFLACYSGKDTKHVCTNLHRHTFYKFRLRAQNTEGSSQWSEEVGYRTLPARPCPPCKLGVKGKVHAHSFKVKWEAPSDHGGADITSYTLQVRKNGEFAVAYVGIDTEYVLDRLNPGTQYEVRIGCETVGGRSDFSDPIRVVTESVCPGQCSPPRVHGKPRPHTVALRWSYPDVDGGSAVTDFELAMRSDCDDAAAAAVYQGTDTECVVNQLLPGHRYLFQVRARNRIGAGSWSEPLEVRSGAAPPGPLAAPVLTPRAGTMSCTWEEPPCNGAPIQEYRLQLALDAAPDHFTTLYQGPSSAFDIKTLPPATLCHLRLQACNQAGWSEFSEVTSVTSAAGSPAAVAMPQFSATPTSLHVSWAAPPDHGMPITHYTVDVAEQQLTAQQTSCDILDLTPNTTYKVRVRAVNSVGSGPYSPALRASTLPLPPSPPPLTCVNFGHNYLKLKWGEGKNPTFTEYFVYMCSPHSKDNEDDEDADEFVGTLAYQGFNQTCKVNRLQEQTTYRFRISASNETGRGPLSSAYEFTTSIAPPPPLKGTKVTEIGTRSCVVEWQSTRKMGSDTLVYCLQVARLKNQEYKQVYLGGDTKTLVGDLEPGAEYLARVFAVRRTAGGEEVVGPHSQPANFSTLPLPDQGTKPGVVLPHPKPHHSQTSSRKQLSDQEWAIIILCGFTLVAVLVAVIMQHFIY